MRVLVACEESQAITKEFRKKGHLAYSCDLKRCSGGHPEWHIIGDAIRLINGDNNNNNIAVLSATRGERE